MASDQHNEEEDRESLMQEARAASQRLIDTIDSASVADCMTLTDDAGWNVRDHLAHAVAFKRGATFLILGKTVAEGMRVQPGQVSLPWDELNEAIREHVQDQPIERAVKDAIDCQRLLEETLESASLDVLDRRNRDVVPELGGLSPEEPFGASFRYCIIDHLDLHRVYISGILSKR